MRQFPDLEYPITQHWLTAPSKRRSQRPASKIRFLVAHDTGNPGSTAAGNVKYYESSCQQLSASAHLFVDDKQIIECVPALTAPPEKAWHVLYNTTEDVRRYKCHANDAALGVEYCYGGGIRADEAYRRYVWVLAYACWKFHLDPAHDIIGHHLLDPKRKTDPRSGLAKSHRTYEQLLLDIPAMYASCNAQGLRGPGAPATPLVPAATLPAWPAAAPPPGFITVRARLNVRYGQPSRQAPGRIAEPGEQLPFLGLVPGEAIGPNDRWYALPGNEYCWSGGIVADN